MSRPVAAQSGRFPTQLQAYGAVLVVDAELRIRFASDGSDVILGAAASDLIGEQLTKVLDVDGIDPVASAGRSGGWQGDHQTASGMTVKIRSFDAGDGLTGLDLRPLDPDGRGSAAGAVERLAEWNERLLEAGSVDELIRIATQVAAERTGFDGAWIVRIEAPDGTGRVISAEVADGAPTALGTLVQPSDLPPEQLRSRGRLVSYFVADLAASTTQLSPDAPDVDLTGSSLLQPFPDWLAWLATVGPRATVGIPIDVGGQLWGWILAHHTTARRVPSATRAELRLLGVATGTRLTQLLAAEEARERLELSRASVGLLQTVAAAEDLVESLTRSGSTLPDVCEARSAVVSIGGRQEVVGDPLSPEVVEQLLSVARDELARPGSEPVVAHTSFGAVSPVEPAQAAGYAAMRLDPAADHVVVWSRPEQHDTVRWASHAIVGDAPQEELFSGLQERPEDVRGSCRPWSVAQLREIASMREALAEVFVARYGALQRFAAELSRSNDEYDAFAHAAAHDLKAPLRGIRQSVEFFLDDTAGRYPAEDTELLHAAVGLVERSNDMLEALMTYAQAGRTPWEPRPVGLQAAVDDAAELLGTQLDAATLVVEPGVLTIDPAAVRQLLLNLLSNAAKYSGGPAHITIRTATLAEVGGSSSVPPTLASAAPETEVLVVADRGIGIAPQHHERIFELFRQVDPSSAGSGAGLAMCRLICRRHGGDIWLKSELGQGTTLYVVAGHPEADPVSPGPA